MPNPNQTHFKILQEAESMLKSDFTFEYLTNQRMIRRSIERTNRKTPSWVTTIISTYNVFGRNMCKGMSLKSYNLVLEPSPILHKLKFLGTLVAEYKFAAKCPIQVKNF